jgi:hypothetical protein
MLTTTIDAFRAILAMDGTLSQAERVRILELITGTAAPAEEIAPVEKAGADRLLSAAEVAEQLHRTKRSVHHLADAGILPRVVLPGRTRGAGFRQSDVDALLQQVKFATPEARPEVATQTVSKTLELFDSGKELQQ